MDFAIVPVCAETRISDGAVLLAKLVRDSALLAVLCLRIIFASSG